MKKLIISLVNLVLSIIGKRIAYHEGKYLIEKNLFFDELIVWRKFFPKQSPLVIFDIGAHVGGSVQFYKKNYPKSIIHSFEPAPDSFEILSNSYGVRDDVFVNHCAVSELTGELTLNIFSDECTGNSVEDVSDLSKIKNQVKIPSITLDQYIKEKEITNVDILKLDTQGHELECLLGAKESLQKKVFKTIKCEVMLHNYYNKKCTISQIEGLLDEYGYTTYDICSIKKSSHRARTLLIDLIFVSKELL